MVWNVKFLKIKVRYSLLRKYVIEYSIYSLLKKTNDFIKDPELLEISLELNTMEIDIKGDF